LSLSPTSGKQLKVRYALDLCCPSGRPRSPLRCIRFLAVRSTLSIARTVKEEVGEEPECEVFISYGIWPDSFTVNLQSSGPDIPQEVRILYIHLPRELNLLKLGLGKFCLKSLASKNLVKEFFLKSSAFLSLASESLVFWNSTIEVNLLELGLSLDVNPELSFHKAHSVVSFSRFSTKLLLVFLNYPNQRDKVDILYHHYLSRLKSIYRASISKLL